MQYPYYYYYSVRAYAFTSAYHNQTFLPLA